MTTKFEGKEITFTVDDVKSAATILDTCRTEEAIRDLLSEVDGSPAIKILACSDYNSCSVRDVGMHPLVAAVHVAFADHRPLVFSPDMIWTLILQGVAGHVKNNAMELRHKLVTHEGKREISISRSEIFLGSPETDWDSIIEELSAQLEGVLGRTYTNLVGDFSTTGAVERTVCQIVLLDMFEPYFDYYVRCVCGIPSITLQGSPSDWAKLMDQAEILNDYDMSWWLEHLRPLLLQFERAAHGDINLEHWQRIYKIKEIYGGETISGWLIKFFPYLKDHNNEYTLRNPALERNAPDNFETTSRYLPTGLSMVPFQYRENGRQQTLQFIGGFTCIEQDEETLRLRPKLGWAIRKAPQCEFMPDGITDDFFLLPSVTIDLFESELRRLAPTQASRHRCFAVPNDFANFYRQCDGVVYVDSVTERTAKIRGLREIARREVVSTSEPDELRILDDDFCILTVADLLDGTPIVMQINGLSAMPVPVYRVQSDGTRSPEPLFKSYVEFAKAFIAGNGQV